jgi:hypothetical protein
MGGGLTVPETANEEECRAFAECAGVEFDAARFTELAVETGVGGELAVTRSQLNELSIPVSNSSDAEANTPAEVVRQPPSPPAIKILLPELVETVEQVFSAGLTPLILDPSHGHNVDTFFRYSNTSILDAKRIGLDVAMGVASEAEGLEEARRALVIAMKRGKSLVVSMQQASPPFSSWLNHPDYFPAQEVFTNAGQALATFDSDWCVKNPQVLLVKTVLCVLTPTLAPDFFLVC